MAGHKESIERRTIAKVSWRLLPLVALAYCIAYIDRSNISFPALKFAPLFIGSLTFS